jgi:hypothetical protein
MRRYAQIIIVIAAITALPAVAAPAPALAADSWASQHPWRVMTQSDAISTSRCIGDPKTPLCAIETVEACIVR